MSKVQFCPLLELERHGAVANLMRIDTVTLLLDCGWTQSFCPSFLQPILDVLSEVSYILISHPTLEYIGALPFLVRQPNFRAEVYATFPVVRMGQMTLYDAYLSIAQYSLMSTLSIDVINAAFDIVTQLKFSEKFVIKDAGAVVTPMRAGHTLGGTVWKVTYDMQDILYAPCVNPHPQRHIGGLDFAGCEQPLLMIMDSAFCTTKSRADEERHFLDYIKDTIAHNGSVLVPVHAAGPTLEMLVMLNEYWDQNRDELQSAGLYFLGNMTKMTIDFIKSHLEWMNERAYTQFESNRDNPFTLKYVKMIQKESEIDYSQPFCILATPIDISAPPSRTVLTHLAEGERNLLLVPEILPQSPFLQSLLDAPKGTVFQYTAARLVLPDLHTDEATTDAESVREEATQIDPKATNSEMNESAVKHFEAKTFPCFSICECKAVADEYGEVFTEAEQQLWREPVEAEDTKEKLSEQALKRQMQTPILQMIEEERLRKMGKCETTTISFRLNMAKVVCLMDARPDLVSTKLMIAKMRPKQIALMNNTNREEISQYAKSQVHVREVNFCESSSLVNLLQHFTIRPIHFSEELYQTLNFHPVDGYEVSFIKGEVEETEDRLIFHIRNSEGQTKENGLFLGSMDMKGLKGKLMEQGYKVVFREGKMVVNDTVLLSKSKDEAGRTNYVLEGMACKEYYELRKMLYSNFIYL